MATLFTRIVRREIPSYTIAEDERYYAFLDIRPSAKGHTLVIPKLEVDYLFDLEDEMLGGMVIFAKRVARAIQAAVPCKKVGMAVIGLEVPHAHIHLIPLQHVSDLSFHSPLQLDADEMERIAADIRAHLD